MTLSLEWKKRLVTHTDRVKAVELHPTETWVLAALYSGQLVLYDYISQSSIKSIEASSLPLRCGKFIKRQNWVVCGGDDLFIRVYDYITLEKITAFEAHNDYIRSIAVHSSYPLIVTSADDLTIKTWDWEKNWQRVQTFEGHAHYVMMVAWSPRDSQLFASASLDRTIKIWSAQAPGSMALASTVSAPDFSLTGHEKGVNSIEYSQSGDKPYLLSAGDDCTVRVWDYQTRQCLQVLTGHSKNVCHACFHPFLPLIMSVAEDGHMRVWNSSTYRHEAFLNHDVGRIWSLSTLKGSNDIALGTDEGTLVLSVGSEKPVASMHQGKILFVKGVEIYAANVKLAEDISIIDGEKFPLSIKEVGSSAVFPQTVSHHPNGRLVAICGDGEYSVLTAQALRNKAYGQAYELVWSPDGSFAVREQQGRIRIFADFEEVQSFKPAFEVLEIFGGRLIGARGEDFICFYDWSTSRFIRRIDCVPTGVYWSDSGDSLVIATASEFFVLTYDGASVQAAIAANVREDDEGLPYAFEVVSDAPECVESGLWVEDCFIFVTTSLRLQTFVSGQIDTIAFLPRKQLGQWLMSSDSFSLGTFWDTYKLHLPFFQFQSAVAHGDMEAAQTILAQVPEHLHERVSRFLYQKGHVRLALVYAKDLDFKLDMVLSINDLSQAEAFIKEMQKVDGKHAKAINARWHTLGDAAIRQGEFDVARQAFENAGDVKGMMLLATTLGDEQLLRQVALRASGNGQANVAFVAYLLLHDTRKCVELLESTRNLAQVALFTRAFRPSMVEDVASRWIEKISKTNAHYGGRLVKPKLEECEVSGSDTQVYFKSLKSQVELERLFEQNDADAPLEPQHYRHWRELSEFDLVEELEELGVEVIMNALLYQDENEDKTGEVDVAVNRESSEPNLSSECNQTSESSGTPEKQDQI